MAIVMAINGVFTPVLTKHSKSFSLIDCVLVGVDRMQRNFDPMKRQVEAWQRSELVDVAAKVVIYEAFVEENWKLQSIWPGPYMICISSRSTKSFKPGQSGAFTSAFKELDPIPQFRATAKLGEFLETRFSQSF